MQHRLRFQSKRLTGPTRPTLWNLRRPIIEWSIRPATADYVLTSRPRRPQRNRLSGLDVFDQQHEGQVVDRRRLEPVVAVEVGGLGVFGVDQDQP